MDLVIAYAPKKAALPNEHLNTVADHPENKLLETDLALTCDLHLMASSGHTIGANKPPVRKPLTVAVATELTAIACCNRYSLEIRFLSSSFEAPPSVNTRQTRLDTEAL